MRSRTSFRSSRPALGFLATTLIAACLAYAAAGAAAKDRYVAPKGGLALCTQAEPCSLATGINGAVAGDTIHVAGDLGPYQPTNTFLEVKSGVTVIGEGAQVPRIVFEGASGSLYVGGSAERLELSRPSGIPTVLGILLGGSVSRLTVQSPSAPPVQSNGLIRDSFVRSMGSTNPAVFLVGKGEARNVTAIASGANAAAIRTAAFPGFMPGE